MIMMALQSKDTAAATHVKKVDVEERETSHRLFLLPVSPDVELSASSPPPSLPAWLTHVAEDINDSCGHMHYHPLKVAHFTV